uniref:Uncharacterized protein n=1 Tax=Eutreptiella gymnastica TaxID=73025 RepID=A0A7S4CZ20_9EUGL
MILERTLVCVGAKRKRGCSLVPESLKNWLVSIDLWCHTILHTYQNASQKKTRPPVPNMGPGPAGPIFFFLIEIYILSDCMYVGACRRLGHIFSMRCNQVRSVLNKDVRNSDCGVHCLFAFEASHVCLSFYPFNFSQ